MSGEPPRSLEEQQCYEELVRQSPSVEQLLRLCAKLQAGGKPSPSPAGAIFEQLHKLALEVSRLREGIESIANTCGVDSVKVNLNGLIGK